MRVLLFDVFGTLVDWRSSLIVLAETTAARGGPQADWAGVDAVLSAQLAASYKPDPQVYLTALRLLDCPPQEAGMVAAHPSDLRAAAALGLRPIFVRRPLEWGPGVPPAGPPALEGLLETGGLVHLAEALGC
jgi:FMN phosphatase YigB (HAD superfamily)